MNILFIGLKKCWIAGLITIIIGIVYISVDMVTFTERNGQEYMDVLQMGDFYEQELSLNHTTKINLDIFASYKKLDSNSGIKVILNTEEDSLEWFYSLNELPNGQWGKVTVNTLNYRNYVGKATLKIELSEVMEGNEICFLIATNNLQPNPDNKFYKNGIELHNSRLNMNFNQWKLNFSLVCIMVLTFVFSYIVLNLTNCIIKKRFTTINFVYLCILFCLFGIMAHRFSFVNVNQHSSAQYFFSWQNLGFQKRCLIGTLVNQFIPSLDVLGYKILGVSINVILLIMELLALPLRCKHVNKRLVYSVFVFFMCTPFYVSTYFSHSFFARLDVYLAILFLVTCVIIIKGRAVILIPVITVVGVLIHEMYLPMFMPFIFVLLLFKFSLCRERKYLYVLGSTSMCGLVLCGYLSWGTAVSKPIEMAWKFIQEKFNSEIIWDFPLKINFYSDSSQYKYENWVALMGSNIIGHFLLSILLLLPIIIAFVMWFRIYLGNQKEKCKRLTIMLFPCTLVGLFVCMFACDWGRWQVLYGIGVFFTFLSWWNMDVDGIQNSMSEAIKGIKNRYGTYSVKILMIAYFTLTYLYGKGGASFTSVYGKVSEQIISLFKVF